MFKLSSSDWRALSVRIASRRRQEEDDFDDAQWMAGVNSRFLPLFFFIYITHISADKNRLGLLSVMHNKKYTRTNEMWEAKADENRNKRR